jgi:hypothetical protein
VIINRPQKLAKMIGETGCYALCLVKKAQDIVGHPLDVLSLIDVAMQCGFIVDDKGLYVKYPDAFMRLCSGIAWSVEKAGSGHTLPLETRPKDDGFEVLRYEREVLPGQEPAHFVLGDGRGAVAWDPYGTSETISKGKLASKRIFTRIG